MEAQRKKTGGRQAGTQNKITGLAKDNIAAVFNRLGGTAGMAEWAEENKTEFYRIYSKLIPVTVGGDEENPVAVHITWAEPKQ